LNAADFVVSIKMARCSELVQRSVSERLSLSAVTIIRFEDRFMAEADEVVPERRVRR
jgi:hypothetical protein